MADNLEIFGETYPNATGIKAKDTNGNTQTFIKPSGTISISTNGTGIDVSTYASANVSVPTGTARTSADLTVSGATVTAPAGLYASAASKSVATMTLPTSTSASATSGYTSKATVSRSTSDQYINIPTGYNSAGAYYKVNAVANGSATAPASISGSSATVSTGTNTLTLTKTVSVTPSVTAGYVSSGTAGNSSVSLTASVTTKGAATITPSTTQQTIASGTYLTGTQTIAAMPSGTAGTPTATKGTISNHSVTVTPSVTNTTGYITGGTKTGTGVTVSASELVSGSETKTVNGTYDVTNLAEVVVNVSGGGGGITAATGTLTLASDVVVPGANQSKELPGIQLSFQPDFFWISMVRSSYDDITTPTNARFYKVLFIKNTLVPPYRVASNISTDTTSANGYFTITSSNVFASTDVSSNGYALNSVGLLTAEYQPYWYLGSDGKVYFGRFSTNTSACFPAGDYRYFAFKI